MNSILSSRVQSIKPSTTLAVAAKAKELKAAGYDIIELGIGEPDFDTPEHIKQAAIAAINAGYTKYTAVSGIPELKKAITAKMLKDNQLNYTPEQIVVSCGAKQSIYNVAQAMLNEGDEVIIPAPYWVSYPDIVILTGAKPVIVKTNLQQNFKITAAQLEKHITKRTKLLILNSPSNPTGMSYTKNELAALGEVLKRHPQVYVLSDDIYEHIIWSEQPFCNIAMACPELFERTITINGVSKAFAMTGWRIGYAATPNAKLIKAITKIQGQSTSSPCSISQYAAIAALTGDTACITAMREAFKERHDYIVNALNQIDGIECLPGQGTFYAFFKVEGLIKRLRAEGKISFPDNTANGDNEGLSSDAYLAEYLTKEANIALIPGSAFGAPGYLRLSFATSLETLQEAMRRLNEIFK